MTRFAADEKDTRVARAVFERECIRLAVNIRSYDTLMASLFEDDIIVTGTTIRHPLEEKEDYLITVRAIIAGEHFVAFHGAPTYHEATEGLINRLRNRTMKWKEDKYAK